MRSHVRSSLLVLSLLALVGTGSVVLVLGNGNATLSVEPQVVSVRVGASFSVDIWITGLPYPMMAWGVDLTWDPKLISYVSHVGFAPNAHWQLSVTSSSGRLEIGGSTSEEEEWSVSADHKWFTINFKCLAPGVSQLALSDDSLMDAGGFQHTFTLRPGTANQTSRSVGGVILPSNAVTVLAPYLAMIGLVAVAATIYVAKRK